MLGGSHPLSEHSSLPAADGDSGLEPRVRALDRGQLVASSTLTTVQDGKEAAGGSQQRASRAEDREDAQGWGGWNHLDLLGVGAFAKRDSEQAETLPLLDQSEHCLWTNGAGAA